MSMQGEVLEVGTSGLFGYWSLRLQRVHGMDHATSGRPPSHKAGRTCRWHTGRKSGHETVVAVLSLQHGMLPHVEQPAAAKASGEAVHALEGPVPPPPHEGEAVAQHWRRRKPKSRRCILSPNVAWPPFVESACTKAPPKNRPLLPTAPPHAQQLGRPPGEAALAVSLQPLRQQ